ncbi:hydroxypyruvate isomerase family protein [Sneathiella sp.]|uniref:hydroxypyruvate isomerase family protein n=1 Tax=Sneathiella sp. TaxID=1964365 RepID=UPI0039E5A25B
MSFLFQDVSFLDRFSHAANAGFKGVEYLFPYDWPVDTLKKHLDRLQLTQVLFNLSPGDWSAGDRGLAALPARQLEYQASIEQAYRYASALNCQKLHVMSGLKDATLSQSQQLDYFQQSLEKAISFDPSQTLTFLIEPINNHDIPGYLLNDFDLGLRLVKELDTPRIRLQFDMYHCQRIHGDVSRRLTEALPYVHHIQIANTPGRTDPDIGELNYPYLFDMLDREGYEGWVGCEYKPIQRFDAKPFQWMNPYLE